MRRKLAWLLGLPLCGALACSPAGNQQSRDNDSTEGGSGSAAGATAQGGSAGSAGGGKASAGAGGQPGAGESSGGGTAGSASGGTGGALPGGAPCDGADIFCSGFEDVGLPPELVFWPEHLRASQTLVAQDSMFSNLGRSSLKVTGTDFSQMLAVAVPSKFWGRVYLRSDSDIQSGHNTYLATGTGSGDPNNGTYIRIGEHQCQLELNRSTDDKELLSNGGQYMCEGGVKLLKDTWYCLEFLFDGPGQETRVFVDGQEVTALHSTDWGVYDYQVFKLGFEKYHGDSKTLWYDDLALGSAQLGCP